MSTKISVLGACGILALSLAAGSVVAGPIYHFKNITNNNAADAAIGEAQLRMEVIDRGISGGVHKVGFKFTNIGSEASVIARIYFDDRDPRTLLNLTNIENSTDPGAQVAFSQDAKPKNLPGGNEVTPVPFQVTKGFSADADSPAPANGVNQTAAGHEWVTLVFSLQSGRTFNDVITAFSLGGGSGGLRVGLHVIGFESGGSEAFIGEGTPENPPPIIPLPATAGLALTGLFAVGGIRRRRA